MSARTDIMNFMHLSNLSLTLSWLKLKKRLIKAVMSNSNTTEVLPTLGSSVTLLSPTHLPPMSVDDLKNLGSSVQWTKDQLRKLVKKQLGDMKVSLQAVGSLSLTCCHSIFDRFLSLSVKSCRVRSWWPLSQLQQVCRAVCSSMSKPRRSYMMKRPWGTSPSRWTRGNWRPCCRG